MVLDAALTKSSLAIAIEALSWKAYSGISERTALFKAAEQIEGSPRDLRQAHRLIMETTRFQNRLEHIMSEAVSVDQLHRAPHGVTSFLKILTYLTYVTRASEIELERNVKWARQVLGWKELHPYEKSIALIASRTLLPNVRRLTELEGLSLDICHPPWLVKRLVEVFGRPFALQLLQRNLRPVPTYVRMNPLRISTVSHYELPRDVYASPVKQLAGVGRLEDATDVIVQSKSWAEGKIVIQDLASTTAGLVASPNIDDRVLDLCAAPGNKTSHLASIMRNKGEIYSVEISPKRFSHWRKEMERTGCSIASPICADARSIPISVEGDLALVDPPCSNTGVLAKNPGIKWRITPSRVKEFVSRQYAILHEASKHIRSGGTIVYCTCSILPEENEEVIGAFLSRSPNFKLASQEPLIGSPGIRGFEKCQRFYTHIHECNGYFIAKLKRID
jgi:16S rRNA (cytosine967-C5)-methyltransferase